MAISILTKTSKYVNFFYGIIVLILAGLAFTNLSFPKNHVPPILTNWKTLNIYDILTVDSDQSCPWGYEQINEIPEWPGTVEGCYCQFSDTIDPGSCSASDLGQSCIDIPATQAFEMRVWRGRVLCLWRGGTSVFWAPDVSDGECDSKEGVEFTKCGEGNYQICVESALGCPVNKIQILPSDQPRPDGYAHSVYFGDSLVLYFDKGNSDPSLLPIIDIAISEDLMCFEPEEGNRGYQNKTYYNLLSDKPEGCDIYDSRYVVIDSISETLFLQDNSRSSLDELPNFTSSDDYLYYIAYRTSILWKEPCQGGYYSRDTLDDNEDPLSTVETIQIVLLAFDSIFALYIMVIDPILYYFMYTKSEEDICEFDQPLITLFMVEMTIKMLMLPLLLVCCFMVGYYRNWFDNLENRYCSDPISNASFQYVDYVLYDIYVYNWTNFALAVFIIFVNVLIMFRIFINKTRENFE